MAKGILQKLVEDAELVADAGARVGRISDPAFFTALSNARDAMAGDGVPPAVVADLQKTLNTAIKDIAPITLNDLL